MKFNPKVILYEKRPTLRDVFLLGAADVAQSKAAFDEALRADRAEPPNSGFKVPQSQSQPQPQPQAPWSEMGRPLYSGNHSEYFKS
jgi:hypothetical protein